MRHLPHQFGPRLRRDNGVKGLMAQIPQHGGGWMVAARDNVTISGDIQHATFPNIGEYALSRRVLA
jgi:hypothetical protein